MNTAATERKNSRLDLRMTEDQKQQIELAASINGMSVSQWSLGQLMQSARRDIAEQGVMRMSAESFDEFARLLEKPPSPDFEEFSKGSTRWDS